MLRVTVDNSTKFISTRHPRRIYPLSLIDDESLGIGITPLVRVAVPSYQVHVGHCSARGSEFASAVYAAEEAIVARARKLRQ